VAASEIPEERRVRVNGVELAYFEWRPMRRGREASILLAHATGFQARVWDRVIRQLGERHVISVDQRGHGRSEKTEIAHWDVFGRDLAALVGELDLRDAVGVGHSMGGHAMTEAAAAWPDRFRRLVLIDPVIASPDDYRAGGRAVSVLGGDGHPTAKRKRRFSSPEEMFDRFEARAPYSVFEPDALRDYCRYGLLPAADGAGFELACPPETEASIYMTSRTNPGVYDSIRALEIPVLVLRAKEPPPDRSVMDFSSSPTWPGLAGEFRKGREIFFADRTHFLPMEIPRRVAALIRAEAGARLESPGGVRAREA
jgi:pimeloyl-ACP methyl ester carboxylesterase